MTYVYVYIYIYIERERYRYRHRYRLCPSPCGNQIFREICSVGRRGFRRPDLLGDPHIRESRILAPVRPRMQAAGLQCLMLQIAVAFPNPQTRTFPGTEFSQKSGHPMIGTKTVGKWVVAIWFCMSMLRCCFWVFKCLLLGYSGVSYHDSPIAPAIIVEGCCRIPFWLPSRGSGIAFEPTESKGRVEFL